MTLVTPPPSQRSLPKRSPFLAHPIQVFPNQAIPSSPPSTRGTTHHKACQSSNQNLLSSIVQQRIIQRLSINSKSKSNLDPQNELVDIQCIQYVLSIRILEYPLYLTITLSTHSHVQQTLQHSPLSQLQNQRTVLHTQPRQVVSTEVRVDQHTTREVDQSLLQRRGGRQPRQCWRQDGNSPGRLGRSVVLCDAHIVTVRTQHVHQRVHSSSDLVLRHGEWHGFDGHQQLLLVVRELPTALLLVADSLFLTTLSSRVLLQRCGSSSSETGSRGALKSLGSRRWGAEAFPACSPEAARDMSVRRQCGWGFH